MNRFRRLPAGARPLPGAVVTLHHRDQRREWFAADGAWSCPETVNGFWYSVRGPESLDEYRAAVEGAPALADADERAAFLDCIATDLRAAQWTSATARAGAAALAVRAEDAALACGGDGLLGLAKLARRGVRS